MRDERLTGPIAGLVRGVRCREVEVLACLALLLRLNVFLRTLPLGMYQRPGPEDDLAVTLIRSMERRFEDQRKGGPSVTSVRAVGGTLAVVKTSKADH